MMAPLPELSPQTVSEVRQALRDMSPPVILAQTYKVTDRQTVYGYESHLVLAASSEEALECVVEKLYGQKGSAWKASYDVVQIGYPCILSEDHPLPWILSSDSYRE